MNTTNQNSMKEINKSSPNPKKDTTNLHEDINGMLIMHVTNSIRNVLRMHQKKSPEKILWTD